MSWSVHLRTNMTWRVFNVFEAREDALECIKNNPHLSLRVVKVATPRMPSVESDDLHTSLRNKHDKKRWERRT